MTRTSVVARLRLTQWLAAAAIAALGALPPAVGHANPLDVVGIRIGMPVDDAIEALKAHNPRLKITPAKVSFPMLPGKSMLKYVYASEQATGYAPEEVFIEVALEPGPAVVTAVARTVRFATGKESARATVLASLREKYGASPYQYPHGPGVLIWYFDGAGQPVARNAICEPSIGNRADEIRNNRGFGQQHAAQYLKRAQQCGSLVYVHLHAGANPELLHTVTMFASDEALFARRYKGTTDWLADLANQSQQRQIRDAGARGAPKF